MLFRIERSGQPRADGGPARVNPDPFPNRPVAGEARIQMILFRVKTENPLPLQLLRIPPKPTKLSVDHPPAPPHVPAPPLSVRARARRSQAAALHPHSQGPLCPVSVFASRISLLIGRAGDAFRSVQVPTRWPATHARTGSRPSLDRFAVSASRREPPIFSDMLHKHPRSRFRQRVACMPNGPTELDPGHRRCADPGWSVAADLPGNPPIRRVDLSRSERHGRRAGRFDSAKNHGAWFGSGPS